MTAVLIYQLEQPTTLNTAEVVIVHRRLNPFIKQRRILNFKVMTQLTVLL